MSDKPYTRERDAIKPGDHVWAWCSRSWDREDKIWDGYRFICQCKWCKAARGEVEDERQSD